MLRGHWNTLSSYQNLYIMAAHTPGQQGSPGSWSGGTLCSYVSLLFRNYMLNNNKIISLVFQPQMQSVANSFLNPNPYPVAMPPITPLNPPIHNPMSFPSIISPPALSPLDPWPSPIGLSYVPQMIPAYNPMIAPINPFMMPMPMMAQQTPTVVGAPPSIARLDGGAHEEWNAVNTCISDCLFLWLYWFIWFFKLLSLSPFITFFNAGGFWAVV